jgi:hypothetical protein
MNTPHDASDEQIARLHDEDEALFDALNPSFKPTLALLDKIAPLNPETLLGNKPVSRVIDLLRRYDIAYEQHTLAPSDERWSAVDLNTYDTSEGIGACIGRGATTHEALLDLLEQIAEIAANPPPRRSKTIYSSAAREEPDEYKDDPKSDVDFDDDLEDRNER